MNGYGWIFAVISIFIAIIFGGSLAIYGLKFEFPGISKILFKFFTAEDLLKLLVKLKSYHILTVVMAIKKEGEIENAVVKYASNKAKRFYGYRIESNELVGKSTNELINILSEWMEPKDYSNFLSDQKKVLSDYKTGKEAYAHIPIIINKNHPYEEYRNKRYIPVIIGLTEEKIKHGKKEQGMIVHYLDMDILPKEIRIFNEKADYSKYDINKEINIE